MSYSPVGSRSFQFFLYLFKKEKLSSNTSAHRLLQLFLVISEFKILNPVKKVHFYFFLLSFSLFLRFQNQIHQMYIFLFHNFIS
jgi:hypothetical protein